MKVKALKTLPRAVIASILMVLLTPLTPAVAIPSGDDEREYEPPPTRTLTPSLCAFNIDTTSPTWGSQVVLSTVPLQGELTSFGPAGTVEIGHTVLESANIPGFNWNQLRYDDWTSEIIKVTLPSQAPEWSAPFQIKVVRGDGVPCGQQFLTVQGPSLCTADILKAKIHQTLNVDTPTRQLQPGQPITANITGSINGDYLPCFNTTLQTAVNNGQAVLETSFALSGPAEQFVELQETRDGFHRVHKTTDGTPDKPKTERRSWATLSLPLITPSVLPLDGGVPRVAHPLRARPAVVSYSDGEQAQAWQFQLLAKVGVKVPSVPSLNLPLEVPDKQWDLPMTQLPIRLPTVVAGFDQRWWQGDGVLFLDPDSGLPAFDAYDPLKHVNSALAVAKNALMVRHTTTYGVDPLGNYRRLPGFFFPESAQIGTQGAEWFVAFVERLAEGQPQLKPTQARERADLGSDGFGWYDRISSIFVIGRPQGTDFTLYEGKDWNTKEPFWKQERCEVHFQVPPEYIAASYWTLHESPFAEGFTSPPVVPTPPNPQLLCDWEYFGNMAKSFRWN